METHERRCPLLCAVAPWLTIISKLFFRFVPFSFMFALMTMAVNVCSARDAIHVVVRYGSLIQGSLMVECEF